ncbi:hypothetical protein BD410DRAFT_787018 [Rickenella mellea]|uniref:Uncharacterized protein n=1 Tax=Rickenella mellea TaxID=50990 RepID=A0A4Y7Q8W0_9AGAM|nr:hypothetical protein BD410DRAFT_787018 [Rickenella mellea]
MSGQGRARLPGAWAGLWWARLGEIYSPCPIIRLRQVEAQAGPEARAQGGRNKRIILGAGADKFAVPTPRSRKADQ